MSVWFIDDEFVSMDDAVVPVTDLGLLRGYGAFDFLRTYGGRPFHLTRHLKRLQSSASYLQLSCPWSIERLKNVVLATLERNSYEESNIRVVITGGESLDSIIPDEKSKLLVMVTPLHVLPQHWYTHGAKVVTANITRYLPQAKSTNYTKAIIALRQAQNNDAIESLYVGEDSSVFEGTTTNIFLVKNSTLITPESGILSGITRKVVLDLAKDVINIEKRPVYREDLRKCQEFFLTASNKEVVPVITIDDLTVGQGKPGKYTLEIMKRFAEYTKSYGREKVSST